MNYKHVIEIGRWMFDFTNEWSQIVGKYNWISFHPLSVYFEKDNRFGNLELEIFVLGFGVRICYPFFSREQLEAEYAKLDAELGITRPKKK